MLYRAAFFALCALALPGAGFAQSTLAQSTPGEADRYLRIPGFPPIPIPPSVRTPRQGDRIDTPRPQTSEPPNAGLVQPQTEPGKPLPKTAPPAPRVAVPRHTPEKRLADLYERLAKSADPAEAQGIVTLLEHQWLYTPSATAGLIMTRALAAMQAQDLPLAQQLLDTLVVLEPLWAEGWNKRATIRFLRDDYSGSMEDIAHVLTLDPRHFGALMGMGTILQRTGNDKRALEAYRRVHEIYPALENVKKIIETMAPDVDGRDI